MSLIAELKRRSVFKVGAAYLVVGWLVVQAASIAFPAFDAPANFLRGFILIVLLGFPVALVMAWMLEVTPEGVKVDEMGVGSKRMFTVAAVLAALAIGWFMRGGFGSREIMVFEAPLGEQSTAVLPFVNMSSDKENDYFSDGLTETLLHKLAQVPQLKVAARTSSFAFKNKQGDIRAIGRELGVATVMEGSVQRAGDTLRITAQLVRTADGAHIWSRNYDRKLADLFAVQDEIAGAVTEALVGALVPEAKAAIAKGGTQSIEAYDLYSKSLALRAISSFTSLNEAEVALKQALDKDPQYVDAMFGLAYTWLSMETTGSITRVQFADRVDPLLDRIEAKDPQSGALLGLRAVRALQRGQRDASLALFERAIKLSPRDPLLLMGHATTLNTDDAKEGPRALELIRRAEEVDPLSSVVLYNLVTILQGLKQPDEAYAAANRLVEVSPKSPLGYQVRAALESDRGRWADEFLDWRRSQVFDPTDHELAAEIALQLDKLGDRAGADAWMAKSNAIAPGNFYPLAMEVHLAFRRGEHASAYAKYLPLIARHDEARRANWGVYGSEACLAAVAIGKRDEFRKAMVAAGFVPDGFSKAAFDRVTGAVSAPHVLGHVLGFLPCLIERGDAGRAQRAELGATAALLIGEGWKGGDAPWSLLKSIVEDDRPALVARMVKNVPTTGDLVRHAAWADWYGIADDPAMKKALDAERAKLAAESARLPKALAAAGISATP